MSVCALLASPAAKGQFQRAIVQSGSCFLRWPKQSWYPSPRSATPYVPRSDMEARGLDVAAKLGCGDPATALDCLRRRPTRELLKYATIFSQIAYGAPVLPADPAEVVRSGRGVDVPVMIGGTHDEHRSMAAGREREAPVTPERYLTILKASFDDRANDIAKVYPASEFAMPVLAWSAAATDAAWACPTLGNARALAARGPTYAYEFAEPSPPNPGFRLAPGVPLGSAHATELAFLFDFPPKPSELTAPQAQLADQMIGYWSRFAATGDPNGAGAPRWPRFGANGVEVMQLRSDGPGVHPSDAWRDHHCAFWATVPVEP
jgi:para-nitrobenzyl esterase